MRICLTALASALITTLASGQGRIFVMPDGEGVGTSWEDATGDLACAMESAEFGTEIWVAQGTYVPAGCEDCVDADRSASFRLRPGVRVTGGFLGDETEASAADPANVTVLSGDIGAAGDPSDNAFNVLFCDGCGRDAALANLTITGGNANRFARDLSARGLAGAGVYLDASDGRVASPKFSSCAIVSNDSHGQGGGIYLNGAGGGQASPTFEHCLIAFNTSRADGGGLYALARDGETSPSFTDTQIRSNGTINPGNSNGQSGAGAYFLATGGRAAVTLDRCLVTRNSTDISSPGHNNGNASANGGGFYLTAADFNPELSLTARNTVISHNASYSGGAVYNNRGHVSLTNVSIVANRALGSGGSGGGLYLNAGTAALTNGLSYGNRVPNNEGIGQDLRFVNAILDVDHTLFEAISHAAAFSCARGDCANDVFNAGEGMIYGADPLFVDIEADVPVPQATSPAIDAGDDAQGDTPGGDYLGDARLANLHTDLGAVELADAPLPAELLHVHAKPTDGSAIRVTWASRSEVNLAGYRVLRSETGDAGDFVEIGSVFAMGSGDYAHLDRAPVPGTTYYYQLQSVDGDGIGHASEVVAAAAEQSAVASADLLAEVYPNPTSGQVSLRLAARDNARTVYATLFDAIGRKLHLWPLTSDGEHVLSLSAFEDGQYVLHLMEGEHEQSMTLLVRH